MEKIKLLGILIGLILLSACAPNVPSASVPGTAPPIAQLPSPVPTATTVIVPTAIASPSTTSVPAISSTNQLAQLRDKIKHVVIIMQENRSFDHYFGTYPGADGIPMQNGVPTVCVPDPQTKQCVKPFHDANDKNYGGPHGEKYATADVDGFMRVGGVRTHYATIYRMELKKRNE